MISKHQAFTIVSNCKVPLVSIPVEQSCRIKGAVPCFYRKFKRRTKSKILQIKEQSIDNLNYLESIGLSSYISSSNKSSASTESSALTDL